MSTRGHHFRLIIRWLSRTLEVVVEHSFVHLRAAWSRSWFGTWAHGTGYRSILLASRDRPSIAVVHSSSERVLSEWNRLFYLSYIVVFHMVCQSKYSAKLCGVQRSLTREKFRFGHSFLLSSSSNDDYYSYYHLSCNKFGMRNVHEWFDFQNVFK